MYWTEPVAVSQLICGSTEGRPDKVFSKPQTRFFGVEVGQLDAPCCRFFLAAKVVGSSCSASRITHERLSVFREDGKLSRWMAAAMHFLQLADVDLGIDRGGFEFFVTEQLLDVTDVRAAFEHVSGAGVPQ